MFVVTMVFIVLTKKHVESHFLAPQSLVGPEAEEEGDGEDGEEEAVDDAHPQPDAHPEVEPSGHLGTKLRCCLDNLSLSFYLHNSLDNLSTSRFFPPPANLSRDQPFDG